MYIDSRSNFNINFGITLFFISIFILKIDSIHIEMNDLDLINRIINPDLPKGKVFYDPSFHYNYILAFLSDFFSIDPRSPNFARTIWFIEQALATFVLVKLCNLISKNDKICLIIFVFLYLIFKSGETDQKTMITFIYFFFNLLLFTAKMD